MNIKQTYQSITRFGIGAFAIVFCLLISQTAINAQTGDQAILFNTDRDGNNEIYKMNSDGTNPVRLTNTSLGETQAEWSPDKTKIVYNQFTGAPGVTQIWIMNADGSNKIQLTNDSNSNQNPSFKPDGTKILFSRCETVNFTCDLYTMNLNGTNVTLVPASNPNDDDDQAHYSRDGTKIVYTGFVGATNHTRLYIANADGSGTITTLTDNIFPVLDFNARFSPDGTKVAFVRASNFNSTASNDVYVINTDGTNLTRLTNNSVSDLQPIWSPDGSKLLISSRQDGDFDIFMINSSNGSVISTLTVNNVNDIASDWFPALASGKARFDFDGDGRSDLSVFRPSNNTWYINRSTAGFNGVQFGLNTDRLTPADFDGDGKTDVAVWRENSSNPGFSYFYILNSSNNTVRVEQFGAPGDDPSIVGDFDGDGKADPAVYREGSTGGGQSFFFYRPSTQPGVSFNTLYWGTGGDKPVRGDFDGDGKLDAAVFRPSDNNYYIRQSSNNQLRADQWGLSTDKFVPADYDGDGKTDLAVFRNGIWYIKQSSNNQPRYVTFGAVTDTLVPADYDGDGKADIAVFRGGVWYFQQSTSGFSAFSFGNATDKAIPERF